MERTELYTLIPNCSHRQLATMDSITNISEESTVLAAPDLGEDHKYHVFISYSSVDSIWVFGLVHKLETTIPGLKICFHERDFVPGKTIIDNMTECIQSSQKMLMVLSPDFVRSRWCLFETNLSMFQDCMLHKAIIPIMLKPCLVPLQLSPLTYLEADDEQFQEKLIQVILNRNAQMSHPTLIHYQSSLLYSGKTLHTLTAVNEDGESWQPGVFSAAPVPDSLRAVVDNPQRYKEAIEIINSIRQNKSCIRHTAVKVVLCFGCILIAIGIILFYLFVCNSFGLFHDPGLIMLIYLPILFFALIIMPTMFIQIVCWNKQKAKLVIKDMKKKTCQANLLLSESSLLVGGCSKSQLFFVFVTLQECRKTFQITFRRDRMLAADMWRTAILVYSSDYAYCLAKKHFPFSSAAPPGHLKEGICFCQYVATQLTQPCSSLDYAEWLGKLRGILS